MSRVAVIRFAGGPPGSDQYAVMLKSGLTVLSGGTGYAGLVKRLFPSGTVGMKASCLARQNSTSPALAEALAKILIEISGIKENNIIVWERTSRELKQAGFTLNAASIEGRCLGTDAADIGYSDEFFSSGKVSSMVSRILTDLVDHSINLALLKDHSLAGMSAGLKNMYGAIHNPNKFHANNCDPFAADVNNLEPIKGKHRLTVIEAVSVQYENGPGFDGRYADRYSGLILSDDPVAADRVALEILQHLRSKHGRPTLADVNRPVKYLASAEKVGLGTAEIGNIELVVRMIDAVGSEKAGELLS